MHKSYYVAVQLHNVHAKLCVVITCWFLTALQSSPLAESAATVSASAISNLKCAVFIVHPKEQDVTCFDTLFPISLAASCLDDVITSGLVLRQT